MKKFLLPALFCSIGISAFAQIANGNFEDWDKYILFQHPNTGFPTTSSNYETFFKDGSLNVFKVPGQESQALRIENKTIEGEVFPGYFLFGELPVTEDQNITFGGGFEIGEPSVTALSIEMKYDFPDDSEGFVIVQFKQNGIPVGAGNYGAGTYFFPISGSQDWAVNQFEFDPPRDVDADQCVIGIASADVINGDIPFNANSFVEIDNVKFINSSDLIPGGNFESFVFVDSIFYPADCSVEIRPIGRTFQRSEQAYEGQYALRLHTIERNGSIDVGTCVMGNRTDGGIIPTIEISENNDAVSFRYYFTGMNDMAQAKFVFYEENAGNFTPVYTKNLDLPANLDYSLTGYAFLEELNENNISASHMSIEFVSSKTSDANIPQIGSILLVDDIQVSSVLGIFKVYKNPNDIAINSYPNPTIGRVTFNFGTNRSGYYRVYNSQGVQIAIREFSSTKSVTHDLFNDPAGKYLFKFYHSGGAQSVRVMKL